jgi:YesN/AraC family two-component response regulator
MPLKKELEKIPLTRPAALQTLVENRRIFNLKDCELNVFESYSKAYHVPLTFNDLVITSMVRGKKIMHLFNQPSFEYLPGETVIVPQQETMIIDFPEADEQNPTQCIALALDKKYIDESVAYLNTFYHQADERRNWQLQFNNYHFENDDEVTGLINKLIRICRSEGLAKNILADLSIKELLIRLMQSQHLQTVAQESQTSDSASRLHYVLHYINEHLTEKIAVDTLSRKAYLSRNIFFKWFREQFGITPLEYINRERIKLAKQLLLARHTSVFQVSDQCGFADVNYFIRVFKKTEGLTPKAYQHLCGAGS